MASDGVAGKNPSIFDALGGSADDYLREDVDRGPKATPSAKKLAEKEDIPLDAIEPTGAGEKITVGDVKKVKEERERKKHAEEMQKRREEQDIKSGRKEPDEYPEGRMVAY